MSIIPAVTQKNVRLFVTILDHVTDMLVSLNKTWCSDEFTLSIMLKRLKYVPHSYESLLGQCSTHFIIYCAFNNTSINRLCMSEKSTILYISVVYTHQFYSAWQAFYNISESFVHYISKRMHFRQQGTCQWWDPTRLKHIYCFHESLAEIITCLTLLRIVSLLQHFFEEISQINTTSCIPVVYKSLFGTQSLF